MSWTPSVSINVSDQPVYSYTHNDNKLTLLLCPVQDSKVCAYMRVIHAGSKDEDACVPTGAAHFIEHMSFRIQKGKIWSLASKGDVINAETNMDSTRFYVVHLPEQTEETIQIDSERYKQAAVPADKVPIERHAVLNELERGEQAGNLMFHTTSSVAELDGGYHHSTIGVRKDVDGTVAEDMEHFRNKYYVPANTTLIFCGAFDPQHIMAKVDEHFGSIPAGKKNETIVSPLIPQIGKRSVELRTPAPCGMVCMAFHQPNANTKESVALQCIQMMTWYNEEGQAKSLIEKGILHDVSVYAPRQKNNYLWFFHGTLGRTSPQIRQMAEDSMLKTVQWFGYRKVSQKRLDIVKVALKDGWARDTESVTDIMNELGRSASIGDWTDYAKRHQALESITIDDIQNIAKSVFKQNNMTVTHVIPSNEVQTPIQTQTLTLENNNISPMVFENASKNTSPWSVQAISPTTNIIHVPRAKYVRAIVTSRFSPAQHDIASLFVSNMGNGCELHATPTSTLMSMHSERSFTHDHEYIHLSMAMPDSSQTLQQAGNLMFHGEWLKPTFTTAFINLQKKHMIAELRSKSQDQSYQLKSHFIRKLFERTIYNEPIDERIRRIGNINERDLHQFHQKWIKPASAYITIVAPKMKRASALLAVFPTNTNTPKQSTLKWTSKPRAASITQKVLPGYGSFMIAMGQTVHIEPHSDDEIALKCAIEILGGGMTARLMHTVREQKGLGTYGLYAVLQNVSPNTDHILCVQGTFSPESVKEGLKCTRELVKEWNTQGVTRQEVENAKQCMIGRQLIGSDDVDSLHSLVLNSILEKRDPEATYNNYTAQIRNLTPEKVNSVLKKYINTSKLTETIIGPTQL